MFYYWAGAICMRMYVCMCTHLCTYVCVARAYTVYFHVSLLGRCNMHAYVCMHVCAYVCVARAYTEYFDVSLTAGAIDVFFAYVRV
jgi:hypothetical protein